MSTGSVAVSAEHTLEKPDGHSQDRGLLLIGLFKLSKAIFFVGVSLGALHFLHHDLAEAVDTIFHTLNFDPENRVVNLLLGQAELVSHHKIRLFSLASAGYGLLCSLEGIGLLQRRTWAEYLTLWLSASFLPWELFELLRHHNLWRFGILLMNALITGYLVWLLRRKRQNAPSNA